MNITLAPKTTPPPNHVIVHSKPPTLAGGPHTFRFEAQDSEGKPVLITYIRTASSSPEVATVTVEGDYIEIYGQSVGTAEIATSGEAGPNPFSHRVEVTVAEPPANQPATTEAK